MRKFDYTVIIGIFVLLALPFFTLWNMLGVKYSFAIFFVDYQTYFLWNIVIAIALSLIYLLTRKFSFREKIFLYLLLITITLVIEVFLFFAFTPILDFFVFRIGVTKLCSPETLDFFQKYDSSRSFVNLSQACSSLHKLLGY